MLFYLDISKWYNLYAYFNSANSMKRSDIIKLPINYNPLVTSKEPEAFVFSILTAKDNSQLPFLLSRYISIFAYDTENYGASLAFNNNYEDFYFSQCGKLALGWATMPNYVASCGAALNIIKALLDENQYVLGVWNEQYINYRPAYNNYYYKAYFMLFGYENQGFYSFGWKDGYLNTFIIEYDKLEKALCLKKPDMNMFWGTVILNAELGFDIYNLKKEFHEFINGDTLNNDGCAFGYKSIEYLGQKLKASDYKSKEYREFTCLWEYTRLMTLRINYMRKIGFPITEQILYQTRAAEKKAFELQSARLELKQDYIIKSIFEISENERALVCELLRILDSDLLVL